MRAISLWQPWASWIMAGLKTIETRIHTRFECLAGETIVIHAAKRYDKHAFEGALSWTNNPVRLKESAFLGRHLQGYLLGTAKVAQFRRLDSNDSHGTLIYCGLGDRFGLDLIEINHFNLPIPWKGSQGIFEIPDKIIGEV